MRRMHAAGWLVGCVCLVAMTTLGCDQSAPPKPPTGAEAAPARTASDGGDDAAAIRSLAKQEAAPAPAQGGGEAQLPSSHPPIAPAAEQAQPRTAVPPGHPPLGQTAAPVPGTTPGELQYAAPAEWKSVPPKSTMRKAQFTLPKAQGDSEDGELIVFYFGPTEGGPTMANLDRWRGQLTDAEGKPLAAGSGTTDSFEANGLKITLLDVSGRYAPGPMPGMPAQGPKDGYRLLAAVVETPSGPWFFKATGPEATIAAHRDAMRKLLESCHE